MKGIMFLEINNIIVLNYIMRTEDTNKKECGALLAVLKKICKTKDFGRRSYLKCFFFIYKIFPLAVASLKY